jgi:hypothetical protein
MSITVASFTAITLFMFLILPIAPFAIWYRHYALRRVSQEARARILLAVQNQTRIVLIAWTVAIFLLGAWGITNGFGYESLSIRRLGFAIMILFHVIWWPCVMPLLLAVEKLAREELGFGSPVSSSVRQATLKPRRMDAYLPAYWIPLTVVVALFGTLSVGAWLMLHPPIESRFTFMAIAFAGAGLLELVFWLVLMRREVTHAAEYGDLDPASAEELRQFRVRGFFWSLIVASSVFFAVAIGCIEVGRGSITEPNLGVVGGIAGTLVGFGGAAFGVAAGLKANRLRTDSRHADLSQ